MQLLQLLLSFAIMARVLHLVPIGVGIVGFESHINSYLLSGWNMRNRPLRLYCKLDIVAIGTMHNPYALDLLRGEVLNMLLRIAHQTQAPNPTPIPQGDMFPIRFQLSAGLLVLNASIIMLKLGIVLLPWLVVLAVVIEARDSKPRS